MPISKHEEQRLNQFEFVARGELDQHGKKRPERTAMKGWNHDDTYYFICAAGSEGLSA